jgi:DNA end-binding protein Ku
MARRLVEDMTEKWKPDEYQDTFTQKIMDLVEKKARDGKVEDVEAGDGAEERKSADIIDLTELLKRSLGGATRGKKTSDEKSHNKDDEEAQNKPKRKPASKAAAPKSAAKATKAPAKKSATSAKAAKDKISEKPTRTPPKRTKAAGK